LLNPLRSEGEAFGFLIRAGAVIFGIAAVILAARAVL